MSQYSKKIDLVVYENFGIDDAKIDNQSEWAGLALALLDQSGLCDEAQRVIALLIKKDLYEQEECEPSWWPGCK